MADPVSSAAARPEDDPLYGQAYDEALAEIDAEMQAQADARVADKGLLERAGDAWKSVGAGIAKAGFETKDLLLGEPGYADKSDIRKGVEARAAELERESGVNSIARSVAQFGTEFIGVGKLFRVGGLVSSMGPRGAAAVRSLQGAVAGYAGFDEHEQRLSNLVESYPSLSNPMTRFLAADPSDGKHEGRFKAALEGLVLDATLAAGLFFAAKAVKLGKAGDKAGAEAAETQAEKLFVKSAKERRVSASSLNAGPEAVSGATNDNGAWMGVKEPANDPAMGPRGAVPQADIGVRTGDDPGAMPPAVSNDNAQIDAAGLPASGPVNDNRAVVAGEDNLGEVVDGRSVRNVGGLPAHPSPNGNDLLGVSDGPVSGGRDFGPDSRAARLPSGGALEAPGVGRQDGAGLDARGAGGGLGVRAAEGADASSGGSVGRAAGSLEVVPAAEAPRAGAPRRAGPFAAEPDIPAALERLRKDDAALLEHGGRTGAVEAGYKFAGESLVPWQKLSNPDEVRAWIGQVAEANVGTLNKIRGGGPDGVLKDARVQRMVRDRAEVFGEDPAALLGLIREAGSSARSMVANMEASYLLANKAWQETYELAQRVANGLEPGAEAALKQRMAAALEIFAQGQAMRASAGRTLRRLRGVHRVLPADLQKLGDVSSLDGRDLARLISSTQGDPAKLAKLANPSILRRLASAGGLYHAANLLWGWGTQVVNLTSTAAMIGLRRAEKYVGGAALEGFGRLTGDASLAQTARVVRRQAAKEVIFQKALLNDGLRGALWALQNGDSRLAPHMTEYTSETAAGTLGKIGAETFRPMDSWDGVLHNAIAAGHFALTADLRLMGAVDELVKTVRYRSVVMAKAAVDAEDAGLVADTPAFRAFVQGRLDDAIDANGGALDMGALSEAQMTTFQQQLVGPNTEDTWGGWMSLGRMYQGAAANVPALRILTPFIKTPANLFRYGVKLTPGLNLLQKEYLNSIRGLKGEAAQAQAIGQMSIGMLLAGSFALLRAEGRITGAGPQDPKARREWMAAGNRPYAIVHTKEDGSKTFYELGRFDPMVWPVMLVSNYVDATTSGAMREEDQASAASAVVMALSKTMADKTYLSNLTGFLEAMDDPTKLEAWAGRTAGGFLPFSAALRDLNADPYLREANGFVETLMARLPGYSEKVPPRRDFLGDPVSVPDKFIGGRDPSPLFDALDEVQALTGWFPQPRPYKLGAQYGGLDLRDVTLSDGRNAYDRLAELTGHPPGGPSLEQALTKLVTSDAYKRLQHGKSAENGTKSSAIADVIAKYRDQGLKRLLSEDDGFREQAFRRQQELYRASKVPQKSPSAEAGRASLTGLNGLLSSYGVGVPVPGSIPEAR